MVNNLRYYLGRFLGYDRKVLPYYLGPGVTLNGSRDLTSVSAGVSASVYLHAPKWEIGPCRTLRPADGGRFEESLRSLQHNRQVARIGDS
jgi:hypothetical protein